MEFWLAIGVGLIVYAIVFSAIGSWIAGQCGRNETEGAVLGALLGPLGLIIEGLLPKFPCEKPVVKQVRDNFTASDDAVSDDKAIEEWLNTR